MKKYNPKIYNWSILGLTLIVGVLSIFASGWWFSGVTILMVAFIYVQYRSERIDHYCVGVDLDTNKQGDVIEILVYAFNNDTKQYTPIMTHYKQLQIYVNVNYLDSFYANIGYPIIEDTKYFIRKVDKSIKVDIKEVKSFYKKMILELNTSYDYSSGSIVDKNIEQPISYKSKSSLGCKIRNWWTFKQIN